MPMPACLFFLFSQEDPAPQLQALHYPLPTGCIRCSRRRYCQGNGRHRVVRGSRLVRLSRPLSRSCTELLQAPLSGWFPPRAISFPLSSAQFVTSQQPLPLLLLQAPVCFKELVPLYLASRTVTDVTHPTQAQGQFRVSLVLLHRCLFMCEVHSSSTGSPPLIFPPSWTVCFLKKKKAQREKEEKGGKLTLWGALLWGWLVWASPPHTYVF